MKALKLFFFIVTSTCFLLAGCDDDSSKKESSPSTANDSDSGSQTSTGENETGGGNQTSGEGTTQTGTGENSGSGNNESSNNIDPAKYAGANPSINKTPSTQNNSANASCNANTFVESCDGNKVVYCSSKGTVAHYDCGNYDDGSDTGYTCAVTLDDDNYNYANCVAQKVTEKTLSNFCTESDYKTNNHSKQCDYYPYGSEYYEYEYEYACTPYSDGYYHWTEAGGKFCSDLCSKGCTQQTCEYGSDDLCSGNAVKTCIGVGTNQYIYVVNDCNAYTFEASCSIDEDGYGACE